MTGFDLPDNYIKNFGGTPKEEPVPSRFFSCYSANRQTSRTHTIRYPFMAKSLHDYSVPVVANVSAVNTGTKNFELQTSLIMMVQANPFYGLPSENANAHLQHFLKLCDTIVIKDVTPKNIRLHLFPFSLMGKVK
jgi:hypothetical protein